MRGRDCNKKISLEEYLDYYDSHKQLNLTSNLLNQIIFMHGFKRIHKVPKRILNEAMETLDLVNLSRSTLRDTDVSPCALLSLDEIIADLKELNWQECCVTSIETLNFSRSSCYLSSDLRLANVSVPCKPRTSSARRGRRGSNAVEGMVSRRKKRAVNAGYGTQDEFGSSPS